jgi:hypothetical protein
MAATSAPDNDDITSTPVVTKEESNRARVSSEASPISNYPSSAASVADSLLVNTSPQRTMSEIPRAVSTPSATSVREELTAADQQLLGELRSATDPVRKWIYDSCNLWHELPIGDVCAGAEFLKVAESIPGIYPYVFSMSFAQKHLTKDLKEQIENAQKHWPSGAVSVRDAIQKEKATMGIAEIEKKYWNTCTARCMWVTRALRIMDMVLLGIVNSEDPVKCAQNAINTVFGNSLSTALKKVADFIIWWCVFKKSSKMFEKMSLTEEEASKYIRVLRKALRPHVEYFTALFTDEVPTVVEKRTA